MHSSKLGIHHTINPQPVSNSEYVIVSEKDEKYGYLFEKIGICMYKCKRIVAENLNLEIISEYPLKMY